MLLSFFRCIFFKDTATTEIYTLSLHDALPICQQARAGVDELGVIAFDIEHTLHALGVRKGRRIEKHQIEALRAARRVPEPFTAVRLHPRMGVARQSVESEIALPPLEVGPGQRSEEHTSE